MRSFVSAVVLGLLACTPALSEQIAFNGQPEADDRVWQANIGAVFNSDILANYGAASEKPNESTPKPLPSRLLHQWHNGWWTENIAVRPNGNLLISTSTLSATVWQVKEPWKENPETVLVYNFDEWADRLIGIGQTTPDTFVVVGSRFYNPGPFSSHVDRTFCAMELDFSKNKDKPEARLIAWFPDAILLQGVAALPWKPTTVLISDQYVLRGRYEQVDWKPSRGQIWRLDMLTGEKEVVMGNYTAMDTTYLRGPGVGINGINIRGNTLFWVNQDTGGVYSFEIDEAGHPVPRDAEPKVLADVDTSWNDFDIGPGDVDTIWATSFFHTVMAISPNNGTAVPIGGRGTTDPEAYAGPTSAAFGKTKHDSHILYVVGNMEKTYDHFSGISLKGWVRAVDTTGFHF
ncbi:hypothetical protein BKA56DRAFT_670983 [Ilyonectria sp. MPI-CAGE-AT-0026]|nr:hypothetical protein BKA56DRAFT_670983 [Ilyonectria sp. MPI-CAGE-AT-0026]